MMHSRVGEPLLTAERFFCPLSHLIHSVRNYTGSWLDWTAQEKQRGNNDD